MNGQNILEINDDCFYWGIHTQHFLKVSAAYYSRKGQPGLDTIETYCLEAYVNIAENLKMCGWFAEEDGNFKRINTHQHNSLCEILIAVDKELKRRKDNKDAFVFVASIALSAVVVLSVISAL